VGIVTEHLELLESWFTGRIGRPARRFGKAGARYEGFSDGSDGVQWNCGIDRVRHLVTVGVNLEGMKYDGWPIARLLLREKRRPTLPEVLRQTPLASATEVWLERDAWQAAARLPISEWHIGPAPPVAVTSLSDELWLTMVREALQSLNADKDFLGRGSMEVTLAKAGRKVKDVSPHLQIKVPLRSQEMGRESLDAAASSLEHVHAWCRRASAY
jgi:hypothetical protein